MSNTKDTPMDYKQFEGENLLVKMTAVLNSLAREYDKIDLPNSIKHLVDKGYELSLEGLQHLSLLDTLTEENESLKLELQKQKVLKDELVAVLDHFYSHGYIHGVNYSDKNKIESLIKKSSEI